MIGDEARAQVLDARGPPARPGGRLRRAAAATRSAPSCAFLADEEVELVGVEAAGEGLDGAPRRLARRPGARACCTARSRRCCRTRTARSSRRTRSRPASTTRASGPSTRTCATPAACATSRSPTTTAVARVPGAVAARGDHPRARARARDRLGAGEPALRRTAITLVTLSGRGDKDLAEVLVARWLRRSVATGAERIAAAFRTAAARR